MRQIQNASEGATGGSLSIFAHDAKKYWWFRRMRKH